MAVPLRLLPRVGSPNTALRVPSRPAEIPVWTFSNLVSALQPEWFSNEKCWQSYLPTILHWVPITFRFTEYRFLCTASKLFCLWLPPHPCQLGCGLLHHHSESGACSGRDSSPSVASSPNNPHPAHTRYDWIMRSASESLALGTYL